MIHAYSQLYLDDACNLLGSYFDIAVNEHHYSADDAFMKFVISDEVTLFEWGYPDIISGLSGSELFDRVFEVEYKTERTFVKKTPEYWLGYCLAYYQWWTSAPFIFVFKYVSASEILSMYHPYHEMDIMHFIEKINELINERKQTTNLEIRRKDMKLTRKELSEKSGVSIRTIEQYEQGYKDINKANSLILFALSKVLLCQIEDLLEFTKQ